VGNFQQNPGRSDRRLEVFSGRFRHLFESGLDCSWVSFGEDRQHDARLKDISFGFHPAAAPQSRNQKLMHGKPFG